MRKEQAEEMIKALSDKLLSMRPQDGGIWRGKLSSSAISTSVAVFALHITAPDKYKTYIENGCEWLLRTMLPDGSWGDSPESPPNMTATLLTYASLSALGKAPDTTVRYINERFGGSNDANLINGVLSYYGKDLTFSAPILVMCALAGIISRWDDIPQLPFELSVLPQRLFRFLRLPVVSYAIPALIAVGILRHKKGSKHILYALRERFIKKSLETLTHLQPSHGGFLEAAPLTAFVAMCMSGAGMSEHVATQKAVGFLTDTVRADGSWSIDTDLACWVTSLSVRALGSENIADKAHLAEHIKRNAFSERHPFTGAKEGGWGWTNLPGSVPDADDTAGALVALHTLLDGVYCTAVGNGIEWLLQLQNADGGMPTFCKGWGKLPFDRSSPDISAHSILAFSLWLDVLPQQLKKRCNKGISRMLRWMRKTQSADGSWTPLWFGAQDTADEKAPVYGTAITVEYLSVSHEPIAKTMVRKGTEYILSSRNADGGWGGAPNAPSKVTFTARALAALSASLSKDDRHCERSEAISSSKDCFVPRNDDGKDCFVPRNDDGRDCFVPRNDEEPRNDAIDAAFDHLYQKYKTGELFQREPIGLYFSRLWYSEELYNITFTLNALKKRLK